MQFLISNILWFIIMIAAAIALLWPYITKRRFGPQVSINDAVELINKQNALVIDVRKSVDFKSGHIARAVNCPADVIQGRLNEFTKDRPIVLVDETGSSARTVSVLMRGVGFQKVSVLDGGLQAWKSEKLPLVK